MEPTPIGRSRLLTPTPFPSLDLSSLTILYSTFDLCVPICRTDRGGPLMRPANGSQASWHVVPRKQITCGWSQTLNQRTDMLLYRSAHMDLSSLKVAESIGFPCMLSTMAQISLNGGGEPQNPCLEGNHKHGFYWRVFSGGESIISTVYVKWSAVTDTQPLIGV